MRLFTYDPVTGLQSIASFVNFDSQTVEASADTLGTFVIGFVPEPSTLALAALGGLALLAYRWRRR